MISIPIAPARFRELLHAWYQIHQRALPWRTTKDPYKIWLSEIILQQTRVSQGLPYYERFIAKYPSLTALAHASEQEVLRLWQGLGYYSRARNLYYCAQTIVEKYGAAFPNCYKELLTLKGIGPYTAAAIAAVSFKEAVAAVDGNVYRVLARIFGLTADIATTKGRTLIHQLAATLVDPLHPDTYSQAIMDFGALQCTPKSPLCTGCVFKDDCVAFQTHMQQTLPIKTLKITKKKRYFDYFIIKDQDTLYMKQRSKGDIWQGMYDFYLLEHEQPLTVDQIKDPLLTWAKTSHLPIITFDQKVAHTLTHQQLSVTFHQLEIPSDGLVEKMLVSHPFYLQPFSIKAIKSLPKPILIHNFLQKFYKPTTGQGFSRV